MVRVRDDYSAAELGRLAKSVRTTAASQRWPAGRTGKHFEIGFIASMLKEPKVYTASQAWALRVV